MPKITELSEVEAKKELAKKRAKGQWATLVEKVKAEKKAVKVEGLTRGQVSAIFRVAKEAGLKWHADYKEGSIVLAP